MMRLGTGEKRVLKTCFFLIFALCVFTRLLPRVTLRLLSIPWGTRLSPSMWDHWYRFSFLAVTRMSEA